MKRRKTKADSALELFSKVVRAGELAALEPSETKLQKVRALHDRTLELAELYDNARKADGGPLIVRFLNLLPAAEGMQLLRIIEAVAAERQAEILKNPKASLPELSAHLKEKGADPAAARFVAQCLKRDAGDEKFAKAHESALRALRARRRAAK